MYARKALKKLPQHTDSTLELTLAENVLKCCDALAADNDSKLDELKLRFKEMIPSSGTSQVSGTSGGMHSSTVDVARHTIETIIVPSGMCMACSRQWPRFASLPSNTIRP